MLGTPQSLTHRAQGAGTRQRLKPTRCFSTQQCGGWLQSSVDPVLLVQGTHAANRALVQAFRAAFDRI